MSSTIAGIKIPDSTLARATTESSRDVEPDLLYHHSRRVFLFGVLSGERKQLAYNPELLYVGAMFHDLGLVEGHRSDDERFAMPRSRLRSVRRWCMRIHGVKDSRSASCVPLPMASNTSRTLRSGP